MPLAISSRMRKSRKSSKSGSVGEEDESMGRRLIERRQMLAVSKHQSL